jgi:hypothetical protein
MKDGTWKAVSEIWDKVLYEDETEWHTAKVDAMAYDNDANSAIQTAMGSALNYLLQNVYQNGFKGLVEYEEYKKQLEEGRKGNLQGRVEA